VIGRNRLPEPPARTNPFMKHNLNLLIQAAHKELTRTGVRLAQLPAKTPA